MKAAIDEQPKAITSRSPKSSKKIRQPPNSPKSRKSDVSSSESEIVVAKPVTPLRRTAVLKTAAKSTAKKKAPTYVFDEQWESHMKERIRQDQNLHMRVLRFEVRIPPLCRVHTLSVLFAACSLRGLLGTRSSVCTI